MNKQTIQDFLKDPLVREAYETDGIEEVARMASMAGVLEKDSDLLALSAKLFNKSMEKK